MASKYQKHHYEDMALFLRQHDAVCRPLAPAASGLSRPIMAIARNLADLFAADNPLGCARCGRLLTASPQPCKFPGGHRFTLGFDRERFLKACGLES